MKGCCGQEKTNPLKLFQLPKVEDVAHGGNSLHYLIPIAARRRAAWLEAIGRQSLFELERLGKTPVLFVCSKHFFSGM